MHSNVGVAPIIAQGQTAQTRPVAAPAPAPVRAPAQPGSAFTTMQLPPTLTIRTGAPGPGQCYRMHSSDQNPTRLIY